MFISDFATVFDCTIWPLIGRDYYGNPEFGAPVFLEKSMWFEATNQIVKNSNGEELVAKYELITGATDLHRELFKEKNYISLNVDDSASPDPIRANAHEIRSAGEIGVPFGGGLGNELLVYV